MAASDLVRVRDGKWEFNRGRAFAEANGLQILEDEPTHRSDGTPRPTTRANGRPVKPRTTVDAEAKKKRGKRTQTSTSDSAGTSSTGAADVANPAADPENSTAAGDTADEPTQKEP